MNDATEAVAGAMLIVLLAFILIPIVEIAKVTLWDNCDPHTDFFCTAGIDPDRLSEAERMELPTPYRMVRNGG